MPSCRTWHVFNPPQVLARGAGNLTVLPFAHLLFWLLPNSAEHVKQLLHLIRFRSIAHSKNSLDHVPDKMLLPFRRRVSLTPHSIQRLGKQFATNTPIVLVFYRDKIMNLDYSNVAKTSSTDEKGRICWCTVNGHSNVITRLTFIDVISHPNGNFAVFLQTSINLEVSTGPMSDVGVFPLPMSNLIRFRYLRKILSYVYS